ncbi:MAG: ribbon-helix-helix protein, CopG family [Candidatus Solibacter usitatus]|nr:ribbon-helix-helix protein, CopG family [Candidatus Solibacter usitatus]
MNITLSIDDEVVRKARQRAEVLGTSVNQVVRDYLQQFAGTTRPDAAMEFEALSLAAGGDRRGWKFDRDELHERR